ncbi:MAG: L-threonylcarbamoyladenylate synthase [Candidatus Margulisbacteria bacterium]|nr:L-threonylcarbamoyladenylate synthase [Candidatus Margulisiibacteriota bacterium]
MTNKLKQAINILKNGGVIAFPTETVFGLGASLKRPAAIKQIFKIKNRPKNKPLQVLIASVEQANKLGKLSKKALALAEKCWPGPLTLVVFKKKAVPKLVTGGTNKVGLRLPDHRIALELIKAVGPLVATSANKSGDRPALTAKAVKKNLPGIDLILPGRVRSGAPSKVVDATKSFKVLRG